MKVILSSIVLLFAVFWSFSAPNISELMQDMILGVISITSICLAISAIRQKEVASGAGLFKFIGLLIAGLIIILNTILLISFVGRWIVAFFG